MCVEILCGEIEHSFWASFCWSPHPTFVDIENSMDFCLYLRGNWCWLPILWNYLFRSIMQWFWCFHKFSFVIEKSICYYEWCFNCSEWYFYALRIMYLYILNNTRDPFHIIRFVRRYCIYAIGLIISYVVFWRIGYHQSPLLSFS